jgi:hypothetical protein
MRKDREWRKDYPCHSPSGFNWGYGGSGPAELAAMILLDLGLSNADAWTLHQRFKSTFLAGIQADTWALHEDLLRPWIDAKLREMGRSDAPRGALVYNALADYRREQTRLGRLTCSACGCDLGDASDPYRDPDCGCCTQREAYDPDDEFLSDITTSCPTLDLLDRGAAVETMPRDQERRQMSTE